jgi:NPCBM/NEW2 domain
LCGTFRWKRHSAGYKPAATDTVPELEALREQHDRAQGSIHEGAQSKLRRLNEEYLQSLDSLIGQLTREGKIASTLAVRAERNRLLSIMAGNAVSKDKAKRDGFRLEESSPASQPMPSNSDYIYLCDLSVISAQADRFVKGGQEKWEVNGKKVRKGLLAWAPSEITYDLTGLNVVTLEGSVGIAPANVNSTMRFEVLATIRFFGRAVS